MEAHRLEIRDHLSFVDRSKRLDRLQFHEEFTPHQQIDTPFPHMMLLVVDRDGLLPFERNAAESEFDHQRFFVSTFEKPRSEVPMHLDRRSNH